MKEWKLNGLLKMWFGYVEYEAKYETEYKKWKKFKWLIKLNVCLIINNSFKYTVYKYIYWSQNNYHIL